MEKTVSFGLPFFYRIVVPGAVAVALGLPLLSHTLPWLGIHQNDIGVTAIALSFFVGFALDNIDNFIWQVCEGLKWWPGPLFESRVSRWERHVRKLHEEAWRLRDQPESLRLGLLWTKLNEFPTSDDGTPMANRPTRLGNLIAAYEEYPYRRYGMDAVFYWPRLWLTLPKEARDEVERMWAVADALIHTGAAVVFVGLAYVAAGLASLLAASNDLALIFFNENERIVSLYGGVLLTLASYLPYRLSFGKQRENGNLFRALFDLYRSKLREELTAPRDDERVLWRELQERLQYGAPAAKRQSDRGRGEVL